MRVPQLLSELGALAPRERRARMAEIVDAVKAVRLEDVPPAILDLLAWKTVEEAVIDYEIALTEVAADVFNRAISRRAAEREIDRLIVEYAADVYREGLAEAAGEDVELTADDQDAIDAWSTDQQQYSAGLAEAMAGVLAEPDAGVRQRLERAIFERLRTWSASLRALGSQAKASGQRNKMVTWRYGDTDHCRTCQRLNGQRHRLSWFLDRGYMPQEPGSDSLECGGWRCQCILEDDDGEQVLP